MEQEIDEVHQQWMRLYKKSREAENNMRIFLDMHSEDLDLSIMSEFSITIDRVEQNTITA